MDDYYNILGVSRNASDNDIKKAYRKLAMKHHPDKGGDGQLFAKINQAYDTLKDPQKKAVYDNPAPERQSQQWHTNNVNSSNMEDIFASMFGHRNSAHRQQRFRNPDITVAADVEIKDVITGKNVLISFRLASGKQETVDVQIPAGAKHGDAIRYESLGDDANPNAPRGNLIVKIRERRDKLFVRDGNNIITTYPVDVFELITGTTVIVDTPDNKKVRLNIPKGTQSGRVFSINGYGIPDLNTRQKGHLYVKINCIIPNISDPKIMKQLQDLKDEISNSTR